MPSRGRSRPVPAVRIALEGPSGVGKSTLARRLERRWNAVRIDEAFDRCHPRPPLRFSSGAALLRTERRLLAEDRRRWSEARSAQASGRPVVMDTGVWGPLSYVAGLAALGWVPTAFARRWAREVRAAAQRGALGLPELTVHLWAPKARIRARARNSLSRHPRALWERHWAVARWERRGWVRLARALPGRIAFVDATHSASAVADRIERQLRRSPWRRGRGRFSPASIDRLLAAFLPPGGVPRARGAPSRRIGK